MPSRLIGSLLLFAAAIPAFGQGAGSFFTGVNPRQISNVPIDTSRAMRPTNLNRAFHQHASPQPFSLANIFPKMHVGTWPPVIPSVPILEKYKNPFQPNPLVGKNPFDPPPKKK